MSSISASSFGGFVLPGGMFLLIYETRRTLRRLVRHLRSKYESARVGTWSENFGGNRRYLWVTYSAGFLAASLVFRDIQTRETKKDGRSEDGERRERGSLPNEYLTHRDTFLYSFCLAFCCSRLFYTNLPLSIYLFLPFSFSPSRSSSLSLSYLSVTHCGE